MANKYQYYGTDFDVIVTLKDFNGNTVNALNPFRCIFTVGNVSATCSYDGTTYSGCEVNSDGTLTCHIDANHFNSGHMYMEYIEYASNRLFQDGNKKFSTNVDMKLVLWDTPNTDTQTIDVTIIPGYVIYELYAAVVKWATDHSWSGTIPSEEEFYTLLLSLGNYDDLQAEITALQTAMESKSDVGHNHAIADVTGLESKLDLLTTRVNQDRTDIATMKTVDVQLDSEIKSVESELQAEIETKQDVLQSGVNIKTINNQSIMGRGNITIQGGGGSSSLDGVTLEDTEEITDKDLYVYTAQQVDEKVDAVAQDLGTLADLKTTAKTSAVVAINEIYDTIGNVETLLASI